MTLPAGMLALLASVTVPSARPAPVSAAVAADWVSPTTFGTATVGMDFVAVLSTSLLQLASNPMNNKVSARLCQCECLLNLNLAPVCGRLRRPTHADHDNNTAGYAREPIVPADIDI